MGLKSVLIVDDDDDIRETVALALEFEGYPILKASNGKEALALLEGLEVLNYPGLIILDLMMPVMDGSSFLHHVHTNMAETLGKIPVILATAKGSLEAIKYAELAQGRMKKPIDLDDLYATVKTYCS